MDYHHHARLTFYSREQLAKRVLEEGVSLNSAAAEFKLSRQSAAKWVRRFRHGGRAALRDRSSRPQGSPRRVGPEKAALVEQLRRQRWTGVRIAQATGLSRATVSRILTRLHLNTARSLEPAIPVVRYEHPAPGDLLHIDIKKLACIA
jgi:transposase